MDVKPFAPSWADTTVVNNATSATAAVILPKSCDTVVLTNTSTTARTQVYVTPYMDQAAPPAGTAPTTSTGMPVLPGQQIRVYVGANCKLIRTIATAADGAIIITPGNGI